MRAFPVLVAVLCLALLASSADAGVHRYKFSGAMDDGTTEFHGVFSFGEVPDDAYPGNDSFGIYTDDSAPFVNWKVTVGTDTYESGGSGFSSDELYVIDGDSDSIVIYSTYSSVGISIGFKDDDGAALDGDALLEPIHNLGWDSMTFSLYDGSTGTTQTGTITAISQPLPPAAWTGLGLLCGMGFLRRIRRRR